jgi:3-oxoacyl-[acyl-carrier-protein] synthase-3
MSALTIVGTGSYLPGHPYSNHDLARVMETNDEWIQQRTGIAQRHYAPEGVGASDLALEAARRALESARLAPEDIDYIIFATMTPDYLLPGSAPLLGTKLGIVGTPALDIRQQCAAMIYGLELADAMLASKRARRVLLVGAEAHAGFMPWTDWDLLEGPSDRKPSPEAFERANEHRALAILFGDGAGAMILEHTQRAGRGLLAVDLHADGTYAQKLHIPSGFRTRPFISQRTVDEDLWIPRMEGRDVFKHAVTKLPKSVLRSCDRAGVKLEDVDLFVAHQANQRINEAVRESLGIPAEKVPSNIARVGNTSAATIPILYDEVVRAGQVQEGMLVCFLALGAGLHWGSALFRV